LLLVMVCANLAGLLLARSAGRTQEIVVRAALGATRARLVRQMLTESMLITAIGGMGGLAVAYFSAPLLVRALPPIRDAATAILPLALYVEPNLRVLAFAFVLCAATAILFGLAPAIHVSRTDLNSSLRAARASGGWRGRQLLVIVEIALCTVLLAGAGLLVRTFEHLHGLDAGFDRDHIVTLTTDPAVLGYTPQRALQLRSAMLERARTLTGVRSVAFAAVGLMHGSGIKMTVAPAGQKTTPSDFLNASLQVITPEYFDTMGMTIIEGRGFIPTDESKKPPRVPVIVNQAFVRRFFPGQSAIGRAFGSGGAGVLMKDDKEIVGVVTNAKYRSIREEIPPTVYQPYTETNFVQRAVLHVRTRMRPASLIGPLRQVLRELDPGLPVIEVRTLAEEVDASLWSERLTASLASIFGGLAALLAAVGIYGLLAYAVAQRTREIGIRMALGAKRGSVLALVGTQAVRMVAAGVVLGLAASLAAAPVLRALLYGIMPNDPATLAGAGVFVIVIAAAATAIPALRATRVEPSIALRNE
jgi:predicted permease